MGAIMKNDEVRRSKAKVIRGPNMVKKGEEKGGISLIRDFERCG